MTSSLPQTEYEGNMKNKLMESTWKQTTRSVNKIIKEKVSEIENRN